MRKLALLSMALILAAALPAAAQKKDLRHFAIVGCRVLPVEGSPIAEVVWPATGALVTTAVSDAPPFRLVTVKVLLPLSYATWKASPVVPVSTRAAEMPVKLVIPVPEAVAAPVNSAASTSGRLVESSTDMSIGAPGRQAGLD